MAILHRRSTRFGFTLVEILIVILIIGMLLAVAVPGFVRARQTSQARNCQSNLKQLFGAKERWAMDNHRDESSTPAMSELVGPALYIKATPTCQANGNYEIGSLDTLPTCSIGGTAGDNNAHLMP
jgi:prepilin-type N-terminal cleavage/methylation domain-containing protein